MKQNNWMPLHIGDYLRDTGHLTTVEHGAYFLLLCHTWTHGGVLPNDEVRLRNIAKMSARDWNRSCDTLRAFFYVDGDTLRQRRVDREMAKTAEISDQRRAAGKASAVARKAATVQREAQRETNKRSTSVGAPVDVSLEQNARQEQEQEQKKERIPPVVLPSEPRLKARTKIASDWKPTDAGVAYAKTRGVPQSEVQAFRDFHTAKGNLMADWDAAWRTWCNHSVKWRNAPLRFPDQPPPMIGGLG